jgi:hypothetical protein
MPAIPCYRSAASSVYAMTVTHLPLAQESHPELPVAIALLAWVGGLIVTLLVRVLALGRWC